MVEIMPKVNCPECGDELNKEREKCPNCGAMIEKVEVKKVRETLNMIDDETFKIKEGDSDTLVNNIKELGSLDRKQDETSNEEMDIEKKDVEETEDEIEVVVYECPICGAEVSEEDDECPECGAIFED